MTLASSKIVPLAPGALNGADFERPMFRIRVPAGTPIEHLLDSSYWSHVARQMRVGGIIEALDECMMWYAEFLIVDKGDPEKNDNWAKVKLLNKYELEKAQENSNEDNEVPKGYIVRWCGPNVRWGVIRESDGKRIWQSEPGLGERADAVAWANQHTSKLAA